MSIKKPIIVKIDQKKVENNQHKNGISEFPSYQLAKREQAATRDENEIQPFTRQYSEEIKQVSTRNNHSRYRMFKPIIFASLSAIIIGSILGVILMNMFVNMDDLTNPLNSNPVSSISSEDSNDQTTDTNTDSSTSTENLTVKSLAAMNAFVLQGGVFSEQANAEAEGEKYKQQGYPSVVWEKEGQYILLVGISNTLEHAKTITESLRNSGLEPFAKEWSTSDFQVELSDKEHTWFSSIQDQLEQTIASLGEQDSLDLNNGWGTLFESAPKESDSVNQLLDVMKPYQQSLTDSNNNLEVQQAVLIIWKNIDALKDEAGI